MRILLTGVTGFIGSHLMKRLLSDGHEIVACARQAERKQKLVPSVRWLSCDFARDTTPDIWLNRLDGIDIAINTVGIIKQRGEQSFDNVQARAPMALFSACDQKGIKVIQVSALGADLEGQPEFLDTKRQADTFLQSLAIDSIIVYPSLVIGRGGTSTATFNTMSACLVTPLLGDGDQKVQPIHIDDVTGAISHMVEHWPGGKAQHQLVGPEVLSTAQLYTTIREWLGLGVPRFLRVPLTVVRSIANLGDRTGVGMLNSDSLRMLLEARTPEATYSGYQSKPLRESLALNPAETADRMGAHVGYTRPLILWSLIFIWIFTGLTSAFFDIESSYAFMATGGITGATAGAFIYFGAAFDFALGVAMIKGYRLRLVFSSQITLMLVYMVCISFIDPAQWLLPFGPITKNLTLLAATLFLFVTEPKRKRRP